MRQNLGYDMKHGIAREAIDASTVDVATVRSIVKELKAQHRFASAFLAISKTKAAELGTSIAQWEAVLPPKVRPHGKGSDI